MRPLLVALRLSLAIPLACSGIALVGIAAPTPAKALNLLPCTSVPNAKDNSFRATGQSMNDGKCELVVFNAAQCTSLSGLAVHDAMYGDYCTFLPPVAPNQAAANNSNAQNAAALLAQQRAQQNVNAANARLAAANANNQANRYQRSLNISSNALAAGANFLAARAANEEAAQQQADEEQVQQQAEQDLRDAQEEQRRAVAAAADAQRRAALCNAFDGSCNQQAAALGNPFAPTSGGQQIASNVPSDNGNPFTAPADSGNPFATARNDPNAILNPGGGPVGVDGRPLSANPTATPDRKLGDPKQAANLASISRSACEAMAPRSDIIQLPAGRAYCVVEVDTPERTNEWHYIAEDAPKQSSKSKLQLPKSHDAVSNGVRD